MDTPPSGMPSPPLSPHGTPSSLISDFPSLSGSLYSVYPADTPYDDSSDCEPRIPFGFSSADHPDSISHLVLPALGLHGARSASANALGVNVTHPNTRREHNSAEDITGNIHLLVLGKHGAGKTMVCEGLLHGFPQPLEAEGWSSEEGIGKTLRASSPVHRSHVDVKITRVNGWDDTDEPQQVLDTALHALHGPFHELDQVFHPSALQASTSSTNVATELLASAATPLYTAAVILVSSTPTPTETLLQRVLSQHVPTISFSLHRHRRRQSPDHSRPQSRHRTSRPHSRHWSRQPSPHQSLHSRAPSIPANLNDTTRTIAAVTTIEANARNLHFTSHHSLREWIFDSRSIRKLRKEAAEKFLSWREKERKVDHYISPPPDEPKVHRLLYPTGLDAYQRFTFDALFAEDSAADADTDVEHPTDADDEQSVVDAESHPLAQGYIAEDRSWETELSRMVALRKRQTLTRLDTIRVGGAHPARRPLSSVFPPADFDTDYYTSDVPSSFPSNDTEYSKEAIDVPKAKMDPLHLPSLISLVFSIIPAIPLRFISKVQWMFRPSYQPDLPMHSDDINEKSGPPASEGRKASTAPFVTVACTAAFAAGIWVGSVVKTDGVQNWTLSFFAL